MLPRRIVALGVGVALVVVLASAATSFARTTMVWTGGSSVQPNEPFTQFTAATGSVAPNEFGQLVPGVDRQEFFPGAAKLSTYKCVMLWLNQAVLQQVQIDPIKNYIQNGGTVLAIGEYAGSPAFSGGQANVAMNTIAAGVGATMRMNFDNVEYGQTSTTTDLGSHPFMSGVSNFFYAVSASVALGSNGQMLARASGGGEQIIAGVENIGTGKFVMLPDSNPIGDSPGTGYTNWGNGQFVRNMCGDNVPPTVTITRPPQNARYKLNQLITSSFACADDDAIASCTATIGGGSPFNSGAEIDTATEGSKSMTARAVDLSGNVATKTHNYVVDETPPTITINAPADGADVTRRALLTANFSCADPDPLDVATITSSTVPNGLFFSTANTGPNDFTVTCRDIVGNVATKTVTYNVVDESPPVIAVSVPKEDNSSRFRLNQTVAAIFTCTDDDGPLDIAFCTSGSANIPTGSAGPKTLTVNAEDLAGNQASKDVDYVVDASPPTIDLRVPANNGRYNRGSSVVADYACADEDDTPTFNDIAKCEGPTPNGAGIDTGKVGTRTFKVDAEDIAGNTATTTGTYTIVGISPPVALIQSPGGNSSFNQGAAIPLSFSCLDPDGPEDLKSCTRNGTGPLDSQTPGAHYVTVRAEDFAGNVAFRTHSYWINPPPPAPAPAKAVAPAVKKKVCKSRRSFTIRIKKKRGLTIKSATIVVNGKTQKAKKGKRFTGKVVLTGLPKGRYTVRITIRLSDGRTVRRTRRFWTCLRKGAPKPTTYEQNGYLYRLASDGSGRYLRIRKLTT